MRKRQRDRERGDIDEFEQPEEPLNMLRRMNAIPECSTWRSSARGDLGMNVDRVDEASKRAGGRITTSARTHFFISLRRSNCDERVADRRHACAF